jgi:hypothetical protein
MTTTTKTTTRYMYVESDQDFSENSHFDHRPERNSWGFSFYTFPAWRSLHVPEGTTREEAINRVIGFLGNEVTSYAGSYKVREITDEVIVTKTDTVEEKIERQTITEIYKMERTTFAQQQNRIQYKADQDALWAAGQPERDAREAQYQAECAARLAEEDKALDLAFTEEIARNQAGIFSAIHAPWGKKLITA